VASPLIVDSSPLIILGKTGLLDLLRILGDPVLIPTAVHGEIQQGGEDDIAVAALREATWIQVVDTGLESSPLGTFGLDAGEEAVLALALSIPDSQVLIDDQAARRYAKALKLRYTGCLGLVLLAKQHGVFQKARPVLEEMRQAGLRLTDRIVNDSLRMVGE
jgi:predicted nucleic acid-binding protein